MLLIARVFVQMREVFCQYFQLVSLHTLCLNKHLLFDRLCQLPMPSCVDSPVFSFCVALFTAALPFLLLRSIFCTCTLSVVPICIHPCISAVSNLIVVLLVTEELLFAYNFVLAQCRWEFPSACLAIMLTNSNSRNLLIFMCINM